MEREILRFHDFLTKKATISSILPIVAQRVIRDSTDPLPSKTKTQTIMPRANGQWFFGGWINTDTFFFVSLRLLSAIGG